MLRFLVRAAFSLLALVLLIFGGITAYIWHLGDEAFNLARADGWFEPEPSDAPMTTFEATMQKAWFDRPWSQREPMCGFPSSAWASITNGRPKPPGISVSLSNQISETLTDQDLTLESHLRRASLACNLEGQFSDVQMMRLYLRHAQFSKELAGAETASQTVLGKPTAELTAEESIRLTALFESQNIRTKPDEWEERIEFVRARLLKAASRQRSPTED